MADLMQRLACDVCERAAAAAPPAAVLALPPERAHKVRTLVMLYVCAVCVQC